MAANFRSRMLHHGKISRVFSVFSPQKKLVNQRLVLARVSGQKGGKGGGWKKEEEKEREPKAGKKRKGLVQQRFLLDSFSFFFLSFSLSFFLAIFHHFLLCPPLSSRNPFYAAMDSQSGRWSRVN